MDIASIFIMKRHYKIQVKMAKKNTFTTTTTFAKFANHAQITEKITVQHPPNHHDFAKSPLSLRPLWFRLSLRDWQARPYPSIIAAPSL